MKKWLFVLICLGSVVNCTGINYFNTLGHTNTNPAGEYANIVTVLAKGGGIYHRALVYGQTGNAKALQVGEACSTSFLGLLAIGDSSINTARKKANLQKIAFVEYEVLGVLGVFVHKFCVKVHGEP